MILISAFVAAFLSAIAAEHCEDIDGLRQSPINIDTNTVIPGFAGSLKWSEGYFEIVDETTLTNDGHSLRLNVNHSTPIRLSGGVLDVPYEFQQLHFHWGDIDEKGSEHKIRNNSYPLEMHAVHSQSSSNDSDEMVVVGYFFRLSLLPNRGLQMILDAAVEAAENRNIPITVDPFALWELISTNAFSYFTYKGSLTTPPYSESVTWIIASTALPISINQMEVLRRAAQVDTGLLNNIRCLQNLNDRTVGYVVPFN